MPVTVIVEPDHGGHRFHAVANVARLAARTGDVVLLTSRGAPAGDEFAAYLGGLGLRVVECFDDIYPPTREMARAVAEQARAGREVTAVVMDADQSLKRWWYVAAQEFRGLPHRPRVVFMLTRYPARLALTDTFGWKLRLSKGLLALLAMATRTLHRVAGFAGRDDLSAGWLVKRARDPAVCTAHARDRSELRAALGLPVQRRLVGIFGVLHPRKHPALVLDAIVATGDDDVDLLLAGAIDPEIIAWHAALPADLQRRVVLRDRFLTNDELDQHVAASDVIALAMTNNGPSGIMGKALAADVPVVTAGSEVRARELRATGGGLAAELTVASFATALRGVLHRDPDAPRANTAPPATEEAFAAALLGIDPAAVAARP